MDIDLRLLRSFVQIHECGALSRAADRLACTPAALSMRLKQVEAEIGAPLFLRHATGLTPTARGAELYARALGVLSAYDEMMSATRARPRRDRIRLGLPDDYALGWLPAMLAGLGGSLDRLEIDVTCDLSARLMAAVERQEIDLALVTLAAPPARARAVARLGLRWLGQPGQTGHDGKAGHGGKVGRDGAMGTGLRLAAYPEGCVFRRSMITALETAGTSWRIALQSHSQAAIFAAVRAGIAVTAVAAGTAPADLAEQAGPPGLPELPEIAIYLVGHGPPRGPVAEAERALIAAFPDLTRLPA